MRARVSVFVCMYLCVGVCAQVCACIGVFVGVGLGVCLCACMCVFVCVDSDLFFAFPVFAVVLSFQVFWSFRKLSRAQLLQC